MAAAEVEIIDAISAICCQRPHPHRNGGGGSRRRRGWSHYPQSEIVWLPPVTPTKVVGLVLNYADHAKELGLDTPTAPVLFFKPLTSLIGHGAKVDAPEGSEQLHYEVELGVVIGRAAAR